MKRFLFITLLTVLLTACAAPTTVPSATAIETMTPSSTVPPSEVTATSIPDVALTATLTDAMGEATSAAGESYLSQLDITFESPEQQLKYNGAQIGGQTSVDSSAASHGIHEVIMTPELQAKLSMRALHNIFLPEEADNDADLAAFATKLADVQAGNGSCADFARSITMYEANSSGDPSEMTIVPSCGLSDVPAGATEIRSINFVTGSWYAWSEELGKNVANPDFPWYDVVIAGGGGGVLFDSSTGELKVMNGVAFLDDAQSANGKAQVARDFEVTLEFLRYFAQGKALKLSSTQKQLNRGSKWISQFQIK